VLACIVLLSVTDKLESLAGSEDSRRDTDAERERILFINLVASQINLGESPRRVSMHKKTGRQNRPVFREGLHVKELRLF